MRNILIVTGLSTSQKLGGLERWYIKLSQAAGNDVSIFLLYGEKLPTEPILKIFEGNQIYSYVFKYNEITSRLSEFKMFLDGNLIGLVWAHFENTVSFLPFAKKMGRKTAWTLHMGNYYYVNKQWRTDLKLYVITVLYRLNIFKKMFFIDKVYCVSRGVQKEFKNFFGHNSKFEINYLGLENELLHSNFQKAIEKKGPREGEIVITCIAFHAKIKGVDLFIKAISELNKRGYGSVKYNQIGGGQYIGQNKDTVELQNLANSLKISNLTFLGIQNDITPFLLETDIYCQPSRHEALSFTVMEAMSLELPVVAANTCGLPELVHNDENGFLFEVENYLDLANKLELLINDAELRKRMGAKSLEIINLPVFSTETNIKMILEDLQTV